MSHRRDEENLEANRNDIAQDSKTARGGSIQAGQRIPEAGRGGRDNERHSLEESTFSQPKSDTSIILRGTQLLTAQGIALSRGATGVKIWESFIEMKQETVKAVERHVGELYDAEEVATCVDLLTGKVEEEGGGMPIKEY